MPLGRPAGTRDSRGGWNGVRRSGADNIPRESAVLSVAPFHACLRGSGRGRHQDGASSRSPASCRAAHAESLSRVCPRARAFLSATKLCAGDPSDSHYREERENRRRRAYRTVLLRGRRGGDRLGFAKQKDGTWYKMTQSGPAVLEDDVEVQANACVDRATVGETRIGRGTKLDDLVLIGHASQVGSDTMLCGQVGLAGSTKVGRNCILAGQVGTAGHLTVGDGSVITAQSGVPNDVPPRSLYSGYPAVENREWLKTMAALNRLPELQKRVRELETQVERLKGA